MAKFATHISMHLAGVLHDSTMAIWSSINDQIEKVYMDTGKNVVVNSAFASKKSNAMLKSHHKNVDANGNPRQRFGMNRQATSIQQLSEWGMRCLQGSFPRIKDKFRYEKRREKINTPNDCIALQLSCY
jgi:hypothetical protein